MNIRAKLKKILPSYRIENRLNAQMEKIDQSIRELNKKQEYLFWLSQMEAGETMQHAQQRICLRMPKAAGRLRNIQLAEKYILERVKDVCDANDLSLFLVGGTLMGAVRHHGFIPWDNDIDIGMMRQDYLKLRELLQNDEMLRAEYCYNYKEGLKISKIKFRAVDVFWIDILVFDYIDVNPGNIDQIWKESQTLNKQHREKIQELSAQNTGERQCRPTENHELDRLTAEFEAEQAKAFPYFGHGDYFCEPINCPWWSRDERGIRAVADYYPLLKDEVEFEGRKYDVWKNYDRALRLSYGDYWSLPRSLSEPHTTEFDVGLEEGFSFLRQQGIIK